jgi:hypothetical protein
VKRDVTYVGCGVVGHTGVDHPVSQKQRGGDRIGAEGAGEGLHVPLGLRGLGLLHCVRGATELEAEAGGLEVL